MPNTRKGYMLIEMLTLLSITVIIMTITVRPLNQVMREIPQNYRDANTFTSISDALDTLKQDIQLAKSVLDLSLTEVGPAMMMLELDKTVVTYEFDTGKVSRTVSNENEDSVEIWRLPKSDIQWHIMKNNNKAYAVEITAGIKKKIAKVEIMILKNNHIFFVGRDR